MKSSWRTVLVYCMTAFSLLICVEIGNRTVSTFAEGDRQAGNICIVIDPGHGGEDGGAVSCTGIAESVYNLEISHRVNDLLNLLGYNTVMVRSEDISVYRTGDTIAQRKISDLKERVKLVNETPGAVLLSIHQNYFGDSKYCGAQVFYAKTEGSEQLAKKLQAEFISTLNPGSRREAKKCSGIYLMERIQCPAILIECGFLSNPQEEEKLRDLEYQKRLGSVIATTVSRYLSNT